MKRSTKLPVALHLSIGLILLAGIFCIDIIRGPQVSMLLFYLIPIGYVCWYGTEKSSYLMAWIAALAWLGQDLISKDWGDSSLRHLRIHSFDFQLWDAFVRFGIFAIIAALTNLAIRLRRLYDAEHEVSELKSNLVSLVSHEFGNMLTIFRLGLTLLRESDEIEPSAERLQHYAMLERVYANLSAAVSSFLNLNRIEAGRFIPHIGKTSLRERIYGMIALLDPIHTSKHIALTTAMPSGPLLVAADPDALTVILSNIMGNAFKYTPDGGAVSVSVLLEASETVIIAIADSGIGISQTDIPHITSGFYRAEGGKGAAKGFGVGLKVVQDLLAAQNSRLEIESSPGRGSRFSFRLPLWRGQIPADVKLPVAP